LLITAELQDGSEVEMAPNEPVGKVMEYKKLH